MLEHGTQLYKGLRWEYEHGLGTIRGVAPKNTKYIVGTVRAALQNASPPKAQSDRRENGRKWRLAIPFVDARPGNNLKATFRQPTYGTSGSGSACKSRLPGCDIGEIDCPGRT